MTGWNQTQMMDEIMRKEILNLLSWKFTWYDLRRWGTLEKK
jgi:hypothetical protein